MKLMQEIKILFSFSIVNLDAIQHCEKWLLEAKYYSSCAFQFNMIEMPYESKSQNLGCTSRRTKPRNMVFDRCVDHGKKTRPTCFEF